MNKESTETSPRRRYRSEVRAAQKDETRQRILETIATKLAQGTFDSLSMEQIAQAAGVGPATLYRHFPHREALLDGLSGYFNYVMGKATYPKTADEITQVIQQSFPLFDQNAALVRAFFISELGRSARSRGRARRIQAIENALQAATAGLDPTLKKQATSIIAYLSSLQTWVTMTQEFALSGAEVGDAVTWAIQVLLAELERARALQPDAQTLDDTAH